MPRTCTICNHRNREAVERALLAGESFRNIAKRSGTSIAALFRHRTDHLTPELAKTHEAQQLALSGSLVDQVRASGERLQELWERAMEIVEGTLGGRTPATRKSGPANAGAAVTVDYKTAVSAINALVAVRREERSHLELVGKITGQLNPPPPAGTSFGPINNLQYIVMPKTPEVNRIERERLAQMTAEQRSAGLRERFASGFAVLSPAMHDVLLGRFPDGPERLAIAAASSPVAPGPAATAVPLVHASELHAADDRDDSLDNHADPGQEFDPSRN